MATATEPNYKLIAKRATAIKIVDVRGNEHWHETGGGECAKQRGLQFSENKNKRVQ